MSTDDHPPILGTPLHAHWRDEEDTGAFARRIADAMTRQPALRELFIALHGELGAGKTTFVRHLLRALGVQGRIKSPTYAVVEPHAGADDLPVHHFDFYRFSDPREWDDAGLRELFAGPGLKLAEWPGNAAGCIPTEDIAIKIEAMSDHDTRHATLSAHTARGRALLDRLGLPGGGA
ncbi:MAG: tRNA (adenosine(37)-N6)-threonylcarbamoyltransferase complex ATPase subunit type 1 TsaE [Xenophilus sp.]